MFAVVGEGGKKERDEGGSEDYPTTISDLDWKLCLTLDWEDRHGPIIP